MCCTMQPITSPTGGRPTPVTAAMPGTSSNEVRTPSAANRRMRAAAAGGSPCPSHSLTAPSVLRWAPVARPREDHPPRPWKGAGRSSRLSTNTGWARRRASGRPVVLVGSKSSGPAPGTSGCSRTTTSDRCHSAVRNGTLWPPEGEATVTVWAAEQVLVGRDADARLLRSFLEQAATGGAALLLTGEPGAGKSALLHATADEAEARGFTVLAAAGVEFEAEVGFAALNQLMLPVLD